MTGNRIHFSCSVLIIISFLIISCEKNKIKDPRDQYTGKYTGIEIYSDLQLGINDTSSVVIFLNKYDKDTISVLELDLPSTGDMYYYSVVNGEIENYGTFYHCPVLTIINDSLFAEWTPSLAPRKYQYYAKKNSD